MKYLVLQFFLHRLAFSHAFLFDPLKFQSLHSLTQGFATVNVTTTKGHIANCACALGATNGAKMFLSVKTSAVSENQWNDFNQMDSKNLETSSGPWARSRNSSIVYHRFFRLHSRWKWLFFAVFGLYVQDIYFQIYMHISKIFNQFVYLVRSLT